MSRFVFCLFLLTLTAMTTLRAQRPAEAPTRGNFVADDDGGFTEIVPVNIQDLTRRPSGAPLMKSVQQVSIFIGAAWGDEAVRPRQTGLADLAARANQPTLLDLQNRNVEILRAAASVEDLGDPLKDAVDDLTIQRKLAEMFESKALPPPAANTVYVVFLAPGIQSTLGQSKAGTDYAAYHNLVHLEAGEVRYVVVPFQDEPDNHALVAARALADTAFNPNLTAH